MNEIMNSVNNAIMNNFEKTDNILNDVQNIIEVFQKEAYRSVNTILSQRNWMIGYRIAEEELAGEERAEYGAEVIKRLSRELTTKYGKGFTKTNLYSFYRFYKCFPEGAVALRISAQLLFLQTETASTRKLLAVGVKYKYATT